MKKFRILTLLWHKWWSEFEIGLLSFLRSRDKCPVEGIFLPHNEDNTLQSGDIFVHLASNDVLFPRVRIILEVLFSQNLSSLEKIQPARLNI